MCLHVSIKKHDPKRYARADGWNRGCKPAPITLEKEITVWKILSKFNTGPYRSSFKYRPNKGYKNRTIEAYYCGWRNYVIVDEGFHAFLSRNPARVALGSTMNIGYSVKHRPYKLVKFTIPKGAKVYYDVSGTQIVSNRVITGDLKHCR